MDRYRWVPWGGNGPPLVFAHANGFPTGTYRPILDHLSGRYRVYGWEGLPLIPGSDPQQISGWQDLAADLADAIKKQFDEPVIGVGHSLGGVLSLLASSSNPGLYRALVLLDPVILCGIRAVIWAVMKKFGWEQRIPLMAGALRRRDHWEEREKVRRLWSDKAAFADWKPEALDAYLEAGIEDDPISGGYRLRYPKRWEARIFELTPHNVWKEVSRLEVPVLVLKGETSDTFTHQAARIFRRRASHGRCTIIEGTGHMLPMQRPETVSRRMIGWIEDQLASSSPETHRKG